MIERSRRGLALKFTILPWGGGIYGHEYYDAGEFEALEDKSGESDDPDDEDDEFEALEDKSGESGDPDDEDDEFESPAADSCGSYHFVSTNQNGVVLMTRNSTEQSSLAHTTEV